jgi:hypothetical protein
MKKLLIVTFLLTFGIIFAQEKEENLNIQKGTWNFGGEFSINLANSENIQDAKIENDRFNFGFSPKFGYTLENNLIIGLGLGYSYLKDKVDYNDSDRYDATSNTYSVFPYIKKIIPITNKFAFILQGELRYSKYKNDFVEYTSLIQDKSRDTFFAGIRPGITYFLTKKIALEANLGSLGYSTSKYDDNYSEEGKTNSFDFNLNSSNLNFGLSLYL